MASTCDDRAKEAQRGELHSIHWAGSDNPLLMDDERFSPAGVLAQKSKADLAFVMHCLSWLAAKGYNLSVSSYVEAEDTRETVYIKTLNAEIAQIVARELCEAIDAILADLEGEASHD